MAYIEDLASQHKVAVADNSVDGTLACYSKSSAVIKDIADKSEQGNEKCNKIYTNAESNANAQLEADRKILDSSNSEIVQSLQSCQGSTVDSAEDAISCYIEKGQSNVSPVSSLTSSARQALRNQANSIASAEAVSNDCSSQVASDSEELNLKVYVNLNNCIAGNGWEEMVIPDLGPKDDNTPAPTTKAPVTAASTAATTPAPTSKN